MKISNKLFIGIIIVFILSGLVTALFTRTSITEFQFKDIFNKASTLQYYPYTDVKFSNGSFADINKVQDTNSIYKYILKGKMTGKRKILYGTVITEIKVSKVLKGNLKDETIYIYEPIAIENKSVWTFEGYNFIKPNKEYIFCLTDSKNKKEKNRYTFLNPFYGKFPLTYKEADFGIFSEDQLRGKSVETYDKFCNFEQIFISKEKKEKYFSEYNKIMKLAKTQ
ncbi:hypothetical protein [Inconstantimicrobium mannanitabidum]|uniref:Uncharacterized protein n=1 Tax=Inconstantimicrobium mannanitabidum TaxID=1604901 RepID=A0ACB5RCA3_9CLOT|nr:hypothetical protein [Clostridium sp. TW13]GKX66710.1 hypothetical protein rsdtw13_19680 [Clostridium sp. TW13]